MIYGLGVAFFAIALLTSVMVHEAGHFLTARAFGMKATKFFVGFGPTLFSRQRGETEYGVKAIPAGGFVKIIGMTPFEEVDPGDEGRAFHGKSLRQRVVVLAAGSFTHFVIAVFLVLGVAFFMPQPKPGARVAAVSDCIATTITADSLPPALVNGACPANSVPSPAKGVLQVGDVITGLNGVAFGTDDNVADELRLESNPTVTLTIVRGTTVLHPTVRLADILRDKDTAGPGTDPVHALGFSATAAGYSQPTWNEGWSNASTMLGTSDQGLLGSIPAAISRIPDRYSNLFNDKAGDLNGPQSVVGIAQISGSIANLQGVPFGVKLGSLVGIIASVNFFVGVLNLLPLLPFDGGHIAVNVVDRLRNLLRRRRNRGAGAISEVYGRFAAVSYALFAVIAVGSILVLFSNIAHPLNLG